MNGPPNGDERRQQEVEALRAKMEQIAADIDELERGDVPPPPPPLESTPPRTDQQTCEGCGATYPMQRLRCDCGVENPTHHVDPPVPFARVRTGSARARNLVMGLVYVLFLLGLSAAIEVFSRRLWSE